MYTDIWATKHTLLYIVDLVKAVEAFIYKLNRNYLPNTNKVKICF